MEGLKKYDSQHKKNLNVIRLLPNDRIILDVRKKKLAVGRINDQSNSSALVYDLGSTDCALEMYRQLRDASKSGKLKNVKII